FLNHVIKTDYWDIDAMADAINAIITSPAMYNTMRQEGLDEVAKITWDKAGQKVIDIYNKVLGR
ncbi:MAG: glycosyltransferase family 1 protein, partial [Muribaculaceae bacterium]|nr:glycosyltransferase family 1 protein [Muribaculaceae bacterium]